MVIAKQYSKSLPRFDNLLAAEKALFSERDITLSAFVQEFGTVLNLDYSLESLNNIEKWFIESGRPVEGDKGYSIPHGIGFYFGEVLCRKDNFNWVVAAYAFEPGCYEIGINRNLLTINLTKGMEPETRNNKRMQSLSRKAKSYMF